MNIEIANRLVNLRKENNLSQEALAEKLGISRQAVSKWERAEASPDTDNLILLARLYGMSLDDLLLTVDEIPTNEIEETNQETIQEDEEEINDQNRNEEYVHVGLGGIHVKEKDGSEVHVGWNGIHVEEKKRGRNSVHIDKEGVFVNGKEYDKDWLCAEYHFPIDIIIIITYIAMGFAWNAWHPGWLIFFAIPIVHTLFSAIKHKNMHLFAYPALALLIFFLLGFFKDMWHPGWVVFLTVPIYYSLVSYIQGLLRKK